VCNTDRRRHSIAEICCKHALLIIKTLKKESYNLFCMFDFLLKQSNFIEQIWAQISGLSIERLCWPLRAALAKTA
jgi:hypothetical protein